MVKQIFRSAKVKNLLFLDFISVKFDFSYEDLGKRIYFNSLKYYVWNIYYQKIGKHDKIGALSKIENIFTEKKNIFIKLIYFMDCFSLITKSIMNFNNAWNLFSWNSSLV